MKFLRLAFKVLGYFLLTILLLFVILAIVSIAPVDRTPVNEDNAYHKMMWRLDSLNENTHPIVGKEFKVGFSKVNLTPDFETATAGYGKRMGKSFEGVHDSLFVRTLVIDNGITKVAIVSADLLIIPPTVTERLKTLLPEIGFTLDNTFLGAIHSHNSIGNWAEGGAAVIYGGYEERVVDFIATRIVKSIEAASQNTMRSEIKSGSLNIDQAVNNRVIKNGPEDSMLRFIEVKRADSLRLVLLTFTAHPTCLSSKDLGLSRDYPGRLVDLVEKDGYDFAMFMAGAVGSHGCGVPEDGMNCVNRMGEMIASEFLKNAQSSVVTDSTLFMRRIGLALPKPQVKIAHDWRVRPFLFNATFGDYPSYLTVLRVGDIVLLGTPCDFSGEFSKSVDSTAAVYHLKAMVTSFNGGYIGYVTPGKYYDVEHYETQLMNWYPPGTGEYMLTSLEKLIEVSAE
jgi:neutral ceramidase